MTRTDRFIEKIFPAGTQRRQLLVGIPFPGQEDDWNMSKLRVLSNDGGQLNPVGIWHIEVEENQVRRFR